jgi:hypothetical protein
MTAFPPTCADLVSPEALVEVAVVSVKDILVCMR